MNLQADYDNELLEFNELNNISSKDVDIFKSLRNVIQFIYQNKFIPIFETLEEQILELRKYLNVSELNLIPNLVSSGAFRAQTSVNYNPYVLFVWQRICESLSEKIETEELSQTTQIAKFIEICQKNQRVIAFATGKIHYQITKIFLILRDCVCNSTFV